MTSLEVKPTVENLKKFLLKDSVGRNKGIANFIKFLDVVEGNMAVALDDNWGNGKTFFVKQTQLVLQSYSDSDNDLSQIKQRMEEYFKGYKPKQYFPIYYDAWSNDNDTDPILSIVFRMLQDVACLKKYETVVDKDWWDIITNGLEVITTSLGGPRIKQFLDSVKGKNILEEFQKSRDIDQIVNEMFDVILTKTSDDTRIVFFIDELDRCCPNFAVRVLERIKHYFLHEKVIFVVSVNMSELQHTIKRHYGNDFNADKYLRRFFNFTIPLPMADMQKYYDLIQFKSMSARYYIADIISKKYNFSLREITRYLQYLNVAVPEKYQTDFEPQNFFYFDVLVPFLIGLNIHDFQKYQSFIKGENFNEFIEVMQLGRSDWLCKILLKSNETFETRNAVSAKLVSLAEKFKPVYECLFGNSASVSDGLRDVYGNGKKRILDTISLMKAEQNFKKFLDVMRNDIN